jgi:hypothetical protein
VVVLSGQQLNPDIRDRIQRLYAGLGKTRFPIKTLAGLLSGAMWAPIDDRRHQSICPAPLSGSSSTPGRRAKSRQTTT